MIMILGQIRVSAHGMTFTFTLTFTSQLYLVGLVDWIDLVVMFLDVLGLDRLFSAVYRAYRT